MAGGWNTGLIFSNAQDVGTNTGNSNGTACTTGGAAYTKGAWTQLIASTAAGTAWVLVSLDTGTSAGAFFAFDIAIGASGSEVVVVSNLVAHQYWPMSPTYYFPLAIKAGTRISARASGEFASDTPSIRMTAFADSALSAALGSAIDTYGFNSSTNGGISIAPGSDTPSIWIQVAASLSNDIAGFFLAFDTLTSLAASSSNGSILVDVAAGASGSEVIIVPRIMFRQWLNSVGTFQAPCSTPFIPIPVQAGTRIAVRAAASWFTTPDNNFGVTLYGVRQ